MLKRSSPYWSRKKTDIATALARSGGFRMTTISRSLGVSRSILIERRHNEGRRIRKLTRNRNSRKEDSVILPLIRAFTDARPSYGYRRVTALLARELRKLGKPAVNHKRVYRIMKENGLALQPHTARPARTHDGKIIALRSNIRWCSDAFRIQCWNGDRLEIAFSLDCHDREAISWVSSSRGIDGGLVRDLMSESIERRFGRVNKAPHTIQWLTDNGPGYTALETIAFGRLLGLEICTTAPYCPESNGMAESFVKSFKRDYVSYGDLSCADMVRGQLPIWFSDYNESAPHKGLGLKSPREYRREIVCN